MMFRWIVCFLCLLIAAAGCAGPAPLPPPAPPSAAIMARLSEAAVNAPRPHLILILDASAEPLARAIISRIGQLLPEGSAEISLYAVGKKLGPAGQPFVLAARPDAPDGVLAGLERLPRHSAPAPLEGVLDAVADSVASRSGPISIVIVGSGAGQTRIPLLAAAELKLRGGHSLCIHAIHTRPADGEGAALLGQMARMSHCGRAVRADEIAEDAALADFLADILFSEARRRVRPADAAAGPAPGDPVGAGMTPAIRLDAVGAVFERIDYRPGEWRVPAKDRPYLHRIAAAMDRNPEMMVDVTGSCDPAEAGCGEGLSERRARAVATLIESRGIAPHRLLFTGGGPSKAGREVTIRALFE
jgi:outer membrane protein OmpA-like peptidoglycan-associated protein